MIQIKSEHIKQAEDLFLAGNPFDCERVTFIQNLTTCDLVAVPGSGKTTALIAKLYCIAQNMPFDNGSGILVIAHTNHAVEEIEKKLKRYCPKLFEYPNFIGTIQSFVNRFLANQACFDIYGSYIIKNNDDLILEYVLNRLKLVGRNAYLYLKNSSPEKTDTNIIEVIKRLKYNEAEQCFNISKNKTLSFTSKSGQEIKKIYDELKVNGNLLYHNSFELANKYLSKFPAIKTILQKRFKFVFIDEMQDLEDSQIKIIDEIFFIEKSESIIQRIGDKNQSIYHSVKEKCDWKTREEMDSTNYKDLSLQNSLRLNEIIGKLVDCFVLERPKNYKVQGAFNIKKEGIVPNEFLIENSIQPHIILFDSKTKGERLQSEFVNLIKNYRLNETESGKQNGFKIIAWNTEWDDGKKTENKIRLKDLFSYYSKESKKKKEDFDSLRKHLYLFDRSKNTLAFARKSILNALIRVLREENIYKDESLKKYFRKRDIIQFIQNSGEENYNRFKSRLFKWSFKLVSSANLELIYEEIKKYIKDKFIQANWNLGWENSPKELNSSKEFIDGNYDFSKIDVVDINYQEVNNLNIPIELASVHSVKGQTHCATMYIETAYKTPIYESLKLKDVIKKAAKKKPELLGLNPLFFQNHSFKKPIQKNALKMMYVGFSRPTHLLCFAALKENFNEQEIITLGKNWKIIDVKNDN